MSATVLQNVSLIDTRNKTCDPATITIENGRVSSVCMPGDEIISDDATVFDLAGKTAMPGMTLGHAHIETAEWLGSRRGEIWLGAELPAGVLMAYAIRNARVLLRSGITFAIGAGSSNDIDVALKMSIDAGVAEGPHIVPCGPHLQATGTVYPEARWWYGMTNTGIEQGLVSGADAFRHQVRLQIHRGAQIIKVFPSQGHGFPDAPGRRNLSKAELAAVVAAAHELGRKVRAHVVYRDLIRECIDIGIDIVDHGDYVDDECIGMMLDRGTTWAPSIHSSYRYMEQGGVDREGYSRDRQFYESVCQMVLKAYHAGVPIIPGDDYGSRIFRHELGVYGQEIEIFVRDVGMSPWDALRCATLSGPETVDMEHEFGTVETGKVADILIMNRNPVDDISLLSRPGENLAAIIKNGEFIQPYLPAEN